MYLLSESCRSLKWTRRQLHTSRTFLNRRSANPWNAFVSKRLNDYNKGPSYCSLHNHQNSKKKNRPWCRRTNEITSFYKGSPSRIVIRILPFDNRAKGGPSKKCYEPSSVSRQDCSCKPKGAAEGCQCNFQYHAKRSKYTFKTPTTPLIYNV